METDEPMPQIVKPVEEMSIEELQTARTQLEEDMAGIKAQLDAAKARWATDGTYADADWYQRARAAQRFKGVQHQQVLRRLGDLARTARRTQQVTRERLFIDICRRRLAPDLYREIWQEVDDEEVALLANRSEVPKKATADHD